MLHITGLPPIDTINGVLWALRQSPSLTIFLSMVFVIPGHRTVRLPDRLSRAFVEGDQILQSAPSKVRMMRSSNSTGEEDAPTVMPTFQIVPFPEDLPG